MILAIPTSLYLLWKSRGEMKSGSVNVADTLISHTSPVPCDTGLLSSAGSPGFLTINTESKGCT